MKTHMCRFTWLSKSLVMLADRMGHTRIEWRAPTLAEIQKHCTCGVPPSNIRGLFIVDPPDAVIFLYVQNCKQDNYPVELVLVHEMVHNLMSIVEPRVFAHDEVYTESVAYATQAFFETMFVGRQVPLVFLENKYTTFLLKWLKITQEKLEAEGYEIEMPIERR